MLEDNARDVELILSQLRRDGLQTTERVVADERSFQTALADFTPQVILSDFSLPRFDGLSALKIARANAPAVPFIFVSGTIGEERAIEALQGGASDYVLKDNLRRLVPAIRNAIRQREVARSRDLAEELLRRSEGRLQGIIDTSADWIWECDRAYSVHYDVGHGRRWMHQRYREAFGKEAADVLWWNPMLNAGVYSLRGDSGAWEAWADLLGRGLRRTQHAVDQIALNVLAYAGDLTPHFLPAHANWLCRWATPGWDESTQRLVHPLLPHSDLGVIHLAGPKPRDGAVEVATTRGSAISRWLTYRGEPR
jgi:CheY-like chemotaxis protein